MQVQHQFKVFPLRTLKALIIVLLIMVFVPQSLADEMSHGEMAGIIRSADHPCTRVLDLQSSGENAWKVQCNSGSFIVIRDADGRYSVTASEK